MIGRSNLTKQEAEYIVKQVNTFIMEQAGDAAVVEWSIELDNLLHISDDELADPYYEDTFDTDILRTINREYYHE